mmetsp:Transcript_114690/g.161024  ORF Transcript_114690/g.161024 Transcript_114690/m.161024 type:complete len:349 (-) Transcript_114690:196-1242(-)
MYSEPAFVMCTRGQSACQPPAGLSRPTHINSEPWKVAVDPKIFDTSLLSQGRVGTAYWTADDCRSTEDGSDRDTTSEGSSVQACRSQTAELSPLETEKSTPPLNVHPHGSWRSEAQWQQDQRPWPQAANTNSVNAAIAAAATKTATAQEREHAATPNASVVHSTCRWHKSASTVGSISTDGHVFTKSASGQKVVINDRGMPMELSSICMVFDSTLRCRGVHTYQYTILSGELGAADGAGFVFDSKVRRNNIQQMRTVFLNQRGVICIRDRQNVRKLKAQLPPLEVGLCLTLTVDLNTLRLHFVVSATEGVVGFAEVCLDGLFDLTAQANFQSGFFCAVVTKEISVSLW